MTRVTIARIAAGGDGVGRLDDGCAIFVPRTVPGDVVDVGIVERRRRFARGVVEAVSTPGETRVPALCPHYEHDHCGGCQLQHLAPEAQLAAKQGIVGDALRRIGHREGPDPDIVPSPGMWHYRTKITLAADGGRLGLHRFDRPEQVFDLVDCPITRDSLMRLWAAIRTNRTLLPADLASLVLREERGGRRHVIAESSQPWDATPLALHVGDAEVSYWWKPVHGGARVVHGPRTGFPALAFEQINPGLAETIREAAVRGLGDLRGKTVWDLYGGTGDTARLLAANGAAVWSVDADATAVEWAGSQAAPAGGRVTYVAARCEEALHRLPPPQAVLVNPPRAGLDERVTTALERWASERRAAETRARMSYVSCDPATLARDLARLPSLAIAGVTAYDLFPQTSHVETVAILEAA